RLDRRPDASAAKARSGCATATAGPASADRATKPRAPATQGAATALVSDAVMSQELTLFVGMFTTLLAIINPLEALPIFLKLLEGKDEAEHRRVARLSCFYALLLAFFFLFFGKLILWIFGVPLSMVRIVGGIILMRLGFELFSPSSSGASMVSGAHDS